MYDSPAEDILFAHGIADSWEEGSGQMSKFLISIFDLHEIYRESVLIPTGRQHQLRIILTGHNFAKFFTSKSDFDPASKPAIQEEKTASVLPWIKNNARWQADGFPKGTLSKEWNF